MRSSVVNRAALTKKRAALVKKGPARKGRFIPTLPSGRTFSHTRSERFISRSTWLSSASCSLPGPATLAAGLFPHVRKEMAPHC